MSNQSQPPKKRHRARNTLLIIAGAFVLLIIIGIAVGGSGSSSNSGRSRSVAAASSGTSPSSAPEASASSPPSPTPAAPTEVEFVITGNVPAGEFNQVDISYGSDSDSHDVTMPSLSGTVTYKVPFYSSAEYYDVNASIDGGSASCKIVALGPGDAPLTVSHGSASGNSECSAQAAPENGGLNWDNEQ